MKQVFHFLLILYFVSFLKQVHSFVFTNAKGVKFNYDINFQLKCHEIKDVVLVMKGVSLPRCVEECGLRQHCASLNYRRHEHVCELFSSAEEGNGYMKGCLFIPATDITIKQDPCANQDCSNERTCDTSTGTCMYKECADDVVLLNGEILGNMKQVGGKIKYTCNSGLNVRDNKEYAECLANGQWSQTAECISACGEVPTIGNGNIILDTADINKALITCDPGFQANPSSTIFCVQGSSTWGDPSCEPIVCGNPDPISNGYIALTVPGSYKYLDTADVTCSSGYQPNVNLITCKFDGDWETASCDRISCGSLPTITHGVATLSVPGASRYQDNAVVTCDAWFQTSTSLIKCTASGSWTSTSCTDVMCYPGTPSKYQGQVSVTVSGKTCQRWDQNTPHNVDVTYLQSFPGNSLSDASNFCRNPAAGSDNPWCYTTDPLVTWEYCAVVP